MGVLGECGQKSGTFLPITIPPASQRLFLFTCSLDETKCNPWLHTQIPDYTSFHPGYVLIAPYSLGDKDGFGSSVFSRE